MIKKNGNTDELLTCVLKGMEDIKGEDIQILDLRNIENAVCDYFLVCTGASNTHVNAIAGSIEKYVSKQLKDKPWHVEGTDNSEWILMDYVDIVVHIFQKHTREFYDIESLWGDAVLTEVSSS